MFKFLSMNVKLFISQSLDKRIGHFKKILDNEGFSKNHPDLLYFNNEEKLGIAEARKIKEHFSLKPYSAKGRAVVIQEAGNLTTEAQNALLKTLEEPPKEAILILGAKNEADLLPTIISRCQVVILSEREGSQDSSATLQNDRFNEEIEKLINSDIQDRFKYIETLEEREEFLKALIIYFREKLHKDPKYLEFAKILLESEAWGRQNVNIRGILEYLMLEMP